MGLNWVLSRVPSSFNMVFNFLDEVMVLLGWEYRKPMNGQDVVENPKKRFAHNLSFLVLSFCLMSQHVSCLVKQNIAIHLSKKCYH